MDNNSEYQKNLQEFFPRGPDKWTKASAATMHSNTQCKDTSKAQDLNPKKYNLYVNGKVLLIHIPLGRNAKGGERCSAVDGSAYHS